MLCTSGGGRLWSSKHELEKKSALIVDKPIWLEEFLPVERILFTPSCVLQRGVHNNGHHWTLLVLVYLFVYLAM